MDTQKLKNIGLHLLIWILLVSMNIIIANNYSITIDYTHIAKSWFLFALIFYVNYAWLMPRFLFRKQILPYIGLVLVMLSGSVALKVNWDKDHMQKIKKEFREARPSMFDMDPGKPTQLDSRKDRPPRGPFGPPGKDDNHFFSLRNAPTVFGILLVLFASMAVRLLQKWRHDEKLKVETDKERIYAELTHLRKQVNPHFLFNALNSIYSLSLAKSDLTAEAIQRLSSILRYMLYKTDNQKVALSDELEIMHSYIELQKLRLTKKVTVVYEIDGNANLLKIEPLLMLPLIENAFKYGADNVTTSSIEIKIEIKDSNIDFVAKNDIVSQPSAKEEGSGLGLVNLRKRLELLYPNKSKLDIHQTEKHFEARLELEL